MKIMFGTNELFKSVRSHSLGVRRYTIILIPAGKLAIELSPRSIQRHMSESH